ncbi:MAG: tRNA nucleotidyltransferase, partial [Sulfuricellaceae bacterium]|nr:tRNA nucleotidyltransferase [Sulfuricellaceae bacterium]
QTHPALSILRLAALSADPDGTPDDETLDLMFDQVETGALAGLAPAEVWPELVRGLMAQAPSNMFRALYACGALAEVLPEVAALFGVPQIAGDPPQVDIGRHLLRVLDETARCGAPLPVRFAALAMNVGKSVSPPEHLPIHYRHVERGRPRIEALCRRFGLAADCRDLALLALVECERVHRVSEIRAGPVAAMLERLGAFDQPERFGQLMTLCACDYRAYPGHAAQDYPKAALLGVALKACAGIDEIRFAEGQSAAEAASALQEARAAAIATAFRSERWSDQAGGK